MVMSVKKYYAGEPNARQKFGAPRDGGKRKHRGVDFSHSTKPGTPVPALLGGKVVSILEPASWHGFGWQVTIDSTYNGVTERLSYAHGRVRPSVKVGQIVKAGQKILEEGTTGATNGSCVHIERFRGGSFVDPMPLIRAVRSAPSGGGSSSLGAKQRRAVTNLNGRKLPTTRSVATGKLLAKGAVGNFTAWMRGEKVTQNGITEDRWLQGTSGRWFWLGGLSPRNVSGLKDANPKTAQRTVRRDVKGANGRAQPRRSAKSNQYLTPGTVGTFNGYRRGEKVTQSGVTTDIWLRGALNGNWFWAGGFTSRSTSGLPKV